MSESDSSFNSERDNFWTDDNLQGGNQGGKQPIPAAVLGVLSAPLRQAPETLPPRSLSGTSSDNALSPLVPGTGKHVVSASDVHSFPVPTVDGSGDLLAPVVLTEHSTLVARMQNVPVARMPTVARMQTVTAPLPQVAPAATTLVALDSARSQPPRRWRRKEMQPPIKIRPFY